MKNKKRIYTVTLNVKYNDGTERSYLKRITSNKHFAEELVQSVYDDAAGHRDTKFGTYSEPKWVNDEHTVLEVTCTCYTGYLRVKFIETYSLCEDWEDNIYSKKIWIND